MIPRLFSVNEARGSRYNWWCGSSNAGSSTNICNVNNNGNPNNNNAENTNIAVAP